VLQLEPELLKEQKEGGGDRRGQHAGDVRVEEDEFPRDQVVEGTRTCSDLPTNSGVVQPKRRRTKSSCS
jgi:hypothetical protein